MRAFQITALLILGACAPQKSDNMTYVARFQTYPAQLLAAVKSVCTDPAQTYRRPSRDLAECRQFLEPDLTAAAILQYDGVTQDLPQLVIRFRVVSEGATFLFQTEAFLNVPQKSGPDLHVLFPNAQLDRQLAAIYREAGGVPVKAPR